MLDQATQLVLLLLAQTAQLPDTALAGLGLSRAELDSLARAHGVQLQALRLQLAVARLVPRSATAELLRSKVNSMALRARNASELAAVARTVKTLPDWVWDDAVVAEDGGAAGGRPACSGGAEGGAAAGRPASYGEGAVELEDEALYLRGQAAEDYMTGRGAFAPQLNRAQRRALEARERKLR